MKVTLAFSPKELTPDSEADVAFRSGGLVLKIWALYKKHFATCQYFKAGLESLNEHIVAVEEEKEKDSDFEPGRLYNNIDEFVDLLKSHGIFPRNQYTSNEHRQWVLKYWDYFNLNVNRQVVLTYKEMQPVEVEYPV